MNRVDQQSFDQRVLVLAPTSKDAALIQSVLNAAGVACLCCRDLVEVCEQLENGAGALLLPEEAILKDRRDWLTTWLGRQPPWSDLPILIIARPGADSSAVAQAMDLLGNVTVVERPTRSVALVSAIRSAIRARLRQYQIRDQVGEQERSERELRDFFDNAAIGLHWLGSDGLVIRANLTELSMLGLAREEFVGHHISEFHEDQDVVVDVLRALAAGEHIIDRPARLRRKDGSLVHVLINCNARIENGAILYSRWFTRDVTDAQRADRDRALLAAIVQSSDDAIISKNLKGEILSWNGAAERLFGYAPSEVIGRPITLIVPLDRRDEEADIIARLSRGERIAHYETVRIAKDGRLVEVSLTISPVRDSSGQVVAASKVARDITLRKHAERKLRESERRFSTFMESLPGLAWIKDVSGRYVFANDAAHGAFGSSYGDLYGKTDDDLFPAETAAQLKENDKRALASDSGLQVIETLPGIHGDRQSLVSKFPIRGSDEVPAFVGGVAIDITDRLRAENALKEADRRKDEFLATLAHELRNPLAPIRNSLHVLRANTAHAPSAAQVHDMMERQVSHMVRLVDDLLELSRVNRGKIRLQRQRIDLATIISQAVEVSRPLIDQAGHRLEIVLPSRPIMIDGDLVRLAQVISNVLNNASRYTDDCGEITITAECDEQMAQVRIRDNGIGIPREMLTQVFEMFTQVNTALRRNQGGLGIGLCLVRTLVEMHGGSVEARSEGIGHGSEFIVRLPIIATTANLARSGGRQDAENSLGIRGLRVLAVDDNRDSADSMGMLLRTIGADVHVAYDGPSALEAIRTHHPAVVLLDLGLPGMDGFEVARRVREDPMNDDVVLVALTGWGQEQLRRRTRQAGFDEHLVKPADWNDLKALLASLQDRKNGESRTRLAES